MRSLFVYLLALVLPMGATSAHAQQLAQAKAVVPANPLERAAQAGAGDEAAPLAPSVHFAAVTEPTGRVSLVWTATNEQAGTVYGVERSSDKVHFVKLDSLDSEREAFGTYFPSVYFFLDRPRATTATCYYRLRQSTPDGAVLYSDVETIEPSGTPLTTARAWLYPNPVPAGATPLLRYTGAQGRVLTVTITDLSGRVHLEHSLSPASSEASAPLLPEGAHLPAGVYQVKVNGTTTTTLTRLVVK